MGIHIGLVTKHYSASIQFIIPTSPNHKNHLFGLVGPKLFGTDCLDLAHFLNMQVYILPLHVLFNHLHHNIQPHCYLFLQAYEQFLNYFPVCGGELLLWNNPSR